MFIVGLKAQVKWHIEQREKVLKTTECLPADEVTFKSHAAAWIQIH